MDAEAASKLETWYIKFEPQVEIDEDSNILTIRKGKLADEVELEPPSEYACDRCPETFTTREAIEGHVGTHVSTNICKLCGKLFSSEDTLFRHEEQAHLNEIQKKCCCNVLQNNDFMRRFGPFSSDCKCYCCSFSSSHFLFIRECVRNVENALRNVHPENSMMPFTCRYCGKPFPDDEALRSHEYIHQNVGPNECKYCFKKFPYPSKLMTHERVHTGEKPFVCVHCNKTFSTKGVLKVHERIHTGEKHFACQFCYKKFALASRLKDHERSHTGEKPHVCSYCSKAFSDKCRLNRHMRAHTGDRRFACQLCPSVFTQRVDLVAHVRVHTGEKPFACSFCSKRFARNHVLRIHERTHTGDKPYMCKFCDRKFIDSSTRTIHERNHTGERPFVCRYCPATFKSTSNLRTHFKRTHMMPNGEDVRIRVKIPKEKKGKRTKTKRA